MNRLFIIFISSVILFSTGCLKIDDKTKERLLLYLLYQNSGNCVTTVKVSATRYDSAATQLPRSWCKDTTIYYTDANEAVSAANAELAKIVDTLTSAGSCGTTISTVQTFIAGQTAANITAAADSVAPKCTLLYSGNQSKPMVFCVNDTELAIYRSNVQSAYQYTVIGDARSDAGFRQNYTDLVNAKLGFPNGLSAAAINNAGIFDTAWMDARTSATGNAFAQAFMLDIPCSTRLLAIDADLKAQQARFLGTYTLLGITAADAANVQSALVTEFNNAGSGLVCCSGTSCPATTTFYGFANPACSSGIPAGY